MVPVLAKTRTFSPSNVDTSTLAYFRWLIVNSVSSIRCLHQWLFEVVAEIDGSCSTVGTVPTFAFAHAWY
jgi:hypothetical protein